jgi:CheY-like chemotaxis protein
MMKSKTHSAEILFVEDDEDDVLLLQHACKKAGILEQFTFFENGRRAVDALSIKLESGSKEIDPMLIFLDLNMPEMNGFEFLRWLRAQGRAGSIPVVILSTSENPADISLAYNLGANAYLVKSNTISELTEMISAARAFWLRYNHFARV